MTTRYLTDEQMEEIKDRLNGTCQTVQSVLAMLDLEGHDDEVNDRLQDAPNDIELCGGCEWWHSVSELEFSEEDQAGFCSQCKPELHDH